MTTDQEGVRRTRRAVLGAALGGAAAVAAGSIRPLGVKAADAGNALIGRANQSNTTTTFQNLDANETTLAGIHATGGVGILGDSVGGYGVHGTSDTTAGVRGLSGTSAGVWGSSGDAALQTDNPGETGVYGYSNTSTYANGVWGESIDGAGLYGTGGTYGVYGLGGIAVQGDAGTSGVGVYGWTGADVPPMPPLGVGVYARAESTAQTALMVVGKFRFSRAGYKDMTTASTTVPMPGMSSGSQVFVVLQTSVSGLYVRAVKPYSGKFTVYLSKSPGKKVRISYMVING